jgi:sugar phosphate isomerase/epimerase
VNRRQFVGAMASVALAWRFRPTDTVGLQLSTVRTAFVGDPEGALRDVAAAGYRKVELYELYGPSGWPASRLRAALDGAGLAAPAVAVPMPLLYRGLERHVDVAATLGCTYVVCAGVDPEERRTLRDWHELAAVYNRAGETARRAGLRVGYRNHRYEFGSMEGRVPYDVLLAETDPALVWFELDLAEVKAGSGDPAAYLLAHRERFPIIDVAGGGFVYSRIR